MPSACSVVSCVKIVSYSSPPKLNADTAYNEWEMQKKRDEVRFKCHCRRLFHIIRDQKDLCCEQSLLQKPACFEPGINTESKAPPVCHFVVSSVGQGHHKKG